MWPMSILLWNLFLICGGPKINFVFWFKECIKGYLILAPITTFWSETSSGGIGTTETSRSLSLINKLKRPWTVQLNVAKSKSLQVLKFHFCILAIQLLGDIYNYLCEIKNWKLNWLMWNEELKCLKT